MISPRRKSPAIPVVTFVQFHEGKLACAVNRNQQIESALLSAHFGNVDVEVADRIALELLLAGLVAGHLRQAADAMPLQATMER